MDFEQTSRFILILGFPTVTPIADCNGLIEPMQQAKSSTVARRTFSSSLP